MKLTAKCFTWGWEAAEVHKLPLQPLLLLLTLLHDAFVFVFCLAQHGTIEARLAKHLLKLQTLKLKEAFL